jgi:hypothetical protein
MAVDRDTKIGFLRNAVEVTKAAATTPSTPQKLAETLQAIYDKQVEIYEKA